jgi:hypothetical protein
MQTNACKSLVFICETLPASGGLTFFLGSKALDPLILSASHETCFGPSVALRQRQYPGFWPVLCKGIRFELQFYCRLQRFTCKKNMSWPCWSFCLELSLDLCAREVFPVLNASKSNKAPLLKCTFNEIPHEPIAGKKP